MDRELNDRFRDYLTVISDGALVSHGNHFMNLQAARDPSGLNEGICCDLQEGSRCFVVFVHSSPTRRFFGKIGRIHASNDIVMSMP